jgi:hypothetical protein
MKFKQIKELILYDGHQIEPMWALNEFDVKGSSVITWIGPLNIVNEKVIDYEDVGLEIKADEMLHFIIEHFDCQPADLRLCYHRQRLFVSIFKDILLQMGVESQKEGDDLYIAESKLSVSIATCSVSSMKIHFGVNIKNSGTPQNVRTACLMDLIEGLNHQDIYIMAKNTYEVYNNEINSIEDDIFKTRVF